MNNPFWVALLSDDLLGPILVMIVLFFVAIYRDKLYEAVMSKQHDYRDGLQKFQAATKGTDHGKQEKER